MKLIFNPIFLLVLGGIVYTVGDFIFKKWALTNKGYLFMLGLLIYLVGSTFLAFSFKYKNIAVASVIIIIFNITFLILISWLYFKEPPSIPQLLGIALAMIAIALMELI